MPAPDTITSHEGIVNAALQRMGLEPIGDFDDDTVQARLANGTYAGIRDAVMREHPWNFCTFHAQLPLATLPTGVWNWDFAYELPPDNLRILLVENQSSAEIDNWTISDDLLLTGISGAATLNVRHIRRVLTVEKYDASFIEALQEKLQFEWSEPLIKATTFSERKDLTSREKLGISRSMDSSESTPQRIEASTWINSR